ncbi:MAG: Carbamoyltransferase HypF [Synergistetes bacterium ADurb.BinA166]|nr:MAG: Carbamoyltransferase HypF [Synergistetes bacterium ADurb.BinA166]
MLFQTRILVSGIVQGVGFRPFCARLADSEGIRGYALNSSRGVEMELHGTEAGLDRFLQRLVGESPPASSITSVSVMEERRESPHPPDGFEIARSRREGRQTALIPADLAVCGRCLSEMRDPSDRRYRYPFINCTDCGPRYTIISELPYDRPNTTMSVFTMCAECGREYVDPLSRRFHAEPNACPVCGPSVWLTDSAGRKLTSGDDAVRMCSRLLGQGRIGAVKGVGGFHIACTPFRDETVALLRERKRRPHKPFAVMAASIGEAERLVHLPSSARRLLLSPAAPIVLCCARMPVRVSRLVAPGQRTLGVMLPYTPLHHLLLEEQGALVMTSANFSDAPIVSDNAEALAGLSRIVDFFLFSDRVIHMPIDDSVAAVIGRSYFLLRRGRGYTPLPMPARLPREHDGIVLGAGAEMKGSFCFLRGDSLLPGQYLGDMKQRETLEYYSRALEHFMRLYELKPDVIAYDMHPQYLSSLAAKRMAAELGARTTAVQHHHAHFAACLFENGVDERSCGVIFDGTGYGEDGDIWGGEFLVGDASGYVRAGHFLPSRLPGGDAAVMAPWRYALGLLHDVFGRERAIELACASWPEHSTKFGTVLDILPASPRTTSCGRFFDAVAALLGLRSVITYDGQAAMELEATATGSLLAPFGVMREGDSWLIDWRPAVRWVVESMGSRPIAEIAGGIHDGLALATAEICGRIGEETGVRFAALSGGVWQNRRLLAATCRCLVANGIQPLLHRLLPPNDECVSAGQAVIAARRG